MHMRLDFNVHRGQHTLLSSFLAKCCVAQSHIKAVEPFAVGLPSLSPTKDSIFNPHFKSDVLMHIQRDI